MRHCLSRGALSLVAPALFLLFWHYASLRIDNAVVLPKIEEVLAILLHPTKDLLNMGSLIGNVTVSFVRVFGGYLLAVFVAVPLGLAMGYWSWLNRMLGLLAGLFRPIPPLSWIPLVLAWFGVASMADSQGRETVVGPKSVTIACPGESHGLRNDGDEDLVFIDLIARNHALKTGK